MIVIKRLFISSKFFQLLRFSNFCSDFLIHAGKRLKIAKVNFKLCDVTKRKQAITIHILPNILRSESNQSMKSANRI